MQDQMTNSYFLANHELRIRRCRSHDNWSDRLAKQVNSAGWNDYSGAKSIWLGVFAANYVSDDSGNRMRSGKIKLPMRQRLV